jgi:hypothetical protein
MLHCVDGGAGWALVDATGWLTVVVVVVVVEGSGPRNFETTGWDPQVVMNPGTAGVG